MSTVNLPSDRFTPDGETITQGEWERRQRRTYEHTPLTVCVVLRDHSVVTGQLGNFGEDWIEIDGRRIEDEWVTWDVVRDQEAES